MHVLPVDTQNKRYVIFVIITYNYNDRDIIDY